VTAVRENGAKESVTASVAAANLQRVRLKVSGAKRKAQTWEK
jgi:hypothetical protein